MTTYTCPEGQALKDLASHQMEVIRDDGVHRHIRFRRPNTTSMWFDLITWNGTLCIDGDMGTHVFRRIEDMFEFFRSGEVGEQLRINPGYWAEKLRAISDYGKGYEEFDSERFRQRVKETFDSWCEENGPVDGEAEPDEIADFTAQKNALWDEIDDDVLYYADEGEIRAIDAALRFTCHETDFNFDDAWEWRCKQFTYHYIWCCYAIVWGIQQYDKSKAAAA